MRKPASSRHVTQEIYPAEDKRLARPELSSPLQVGRYSLGDYWLGPCSGRHHSTMSLRIGIDLDGTVADLSSALRKSARLRRPEATPAGDDKAATDTEYGDGSQPDGVSGSDVRSGWSHIRRVENFWCTLDELETGAVARLAVLAARHEWEVIFLTDRPKTPGESVQVQSQRWLQMRGFELPTVWVVSKASRGSVAAALQLDTVIDDRLENCLDVTLESTARAVLVWRNTRGPMPMAATHARIDAVPSFEAALDYHEDLSMRARKPPGRGGTIRRFLGV